MMRTCLAVTVLVTGKRLANQLCTTTRGRWMGGTRRAWAVGQMARGLGILVDALVSRVSMLGGTRSGERGDLLTQVMEARVRVRVRVEVSPESRLQTRLWTGKRTPGGTGWAPCHRMREATCSWARGTGQILMGRGRMAQATARGRRQVRLAGRWWCAIQ